MPGSTQADPWLAASNKRSANLGAGVGEGLLCWLSQLKTVSPRMSRSAESRALASLSANSHLSGPQVCLQELNLNTSGAVSCPLMGFFLAHQGRFHKQPGMALPGQLMGDKASRTLVCCYHGNVAFQTLQATFLASAAVNDSDGEGPLLFLQ